MTWETARLVIGVGLIASSVWMACTRSNAAAQPTQPPRPTSVLSPDNKYGTEVWRSPKTGNCVEFIYRSSELAGVFLVECPS